MTYETSATRAAYLAGVRAAFDELMPQLPARALHEMDEWLAELDAWTGGAPPLSPAHWPVG